MRLRPTIAAALLALSVCIAPAGAGQAGASPRVALVAYPAKLGSRPDVLDLEITGFRSAVRRLGLRGDVVYIGPNEDSATALRAAARRGYDLVVAGVPEPEAVERVARAFPHVRFLMVDVPTVALARREPNVTGTLFRAEEAGYLAGYLAASLADREPAPHVVGAVGGTEYPPVTRWLVGYRAGAKHADPDVVVRTAYSNDFLDATKCARLARLQLAAGAKVIYDVAGACGLGALHAASAAGAWGIGVDVDLSYLGRRIATSTLLRLDRGIFSSLRRFRAGKLPRGGDVRYGLADGGVGLAPLDAHVPPVVARRVEALRAAIVAGRIRVPHVT